MDGVFESLFKYPRILFEKGTFSFKFLSPTWLAVATAVLLVLSFLVYRRWSRSASTGLLLFLSVVRTAALSLILFCLLKPVILVSSAIPLKNFVAVLYDTSRSMSIRDEAGGKARVERIKDLFNDPKFSDRLQQRFQVRYFGFAESARRVNTNEVGAANGDATRIDEAVRTVLGELHSAPLSGIILISDGADNGSTRLTELVNELKSKNVPLYTVGVGKEKLPRDIEVVKVVAPRSVMKDSLVMADVAVKNSGYAGKRVILDVLEDNRIVQSKPITLSDDNQISNHKIGFTAARPGLHTYTASIKPQPNEPITENNAQEFLVRTEDAQARVLYIEGEPRWEYKFLLRALEEDKNIIVDRFLRTGKKQSLWQGSEAKEQLVDGFPKDRRTLFKYKGILLGRVEASFFNLEQSKMTDDFVSRRGGGFLMLGNEKNFGGYAGTPLESLLPLSIGPQPEASQGDFEAKVQLTDYGKRHPMTRLSADEQENLRLWNALPPVQLYPAALAMKPGATALLTASVSGSGRSWLPVLSFQRYGRGRSVVFLPDNSWRWRMGLDSQNKSFETFWKELVRWIVGNAPDPVTVEVDKDLVPMRGSVEIKAEVNDDTFTRVNNAKVKARIVSARGKSDEIPLEWIGKEDGVYRAYYQPKEEGLYSVQVTADLSKPGKVLGTARTGFKAGPSNVEFSNPTLNRDLLTRLAQETHGQYYNIAEADRIPEEIIYNKNNASTVVEKDLWDMPVLFVLFIALLLTEWSVRKYYRMA